MNVPLHKFEEWLRNKNLKDRTLENYLYYFNKFTYPGFDQESVAWFLALQQNRNTVARAFLINFQKFLQVNYQALGLNEEQRMRVAEVELPRLSGRRKQRIIQPIAHEHIELLEQALETEQLKLQLLLSYYCALRLGELLKIKILSFNWEEWGKDTSKMGECRVYGKGDKEGIALVPSFLMKRLGIFIKSRSFISIDSKIFMTNKEDANIQNCGRTWQMRLHEAGVKSGLTKFDLKNEPIKDTIVHPHRLRHSYATYLLNVKGLDIREVQEILRHTSIQSTQIYTHMNKEHLKAKLSQP